MLFVLILNDYYPKNIQKRFSSPKNVGKAENTSAIGVEANFVCGSFIRFSLSIEPVTKLIEDIRFNSNGCGFMIAAADAVSDYVKLKLLTDLKGLANAEMEAYIESELGKFPYARVDCVKACIEAVHAAFADYRASQIEKYRDDTVLICTCFGISEETIEECIREGGLNSVKQVTEICKAGSGCGSCCMLIQEIIDASVI